VPGWFRAAWPTVITGSAPFTRLARKRDHYDRVAEAAAPVLDRLCQRVLWSSDLMVPAGDHMERRETSQAYTPFFFIHPARRIRVGQSVNWLLTGAGRAYLAFCPEQEREGILRMLRRSDQPEDRLARDPKRLDKILAETRARGYGTRDPIFTGGKYGASPFDDGLAAIAVPLLDRTRVRGSIHILWIRTGLSAGRRGRERFDPAQRTAVAGVNRSNKHLIGAGENLLGSSLASPAEVGH
jgi:IclR family mhp operon transcriptional activator